MLRRCQDKIECVLQNAYPLEDEIHTIVGAGGTGDGGGAIDAGNIMKPALSRGELQAPATKTHNCETPCETRCESCRFGSPMTWSLVEITTSRRSLVPQPLKSTVNTSRKTRLLGLSIRWCILVPFRMFDCCFFKDMFSLLFDVVDSVFVFRPL